MTDRDKDSERLTALLLAERLCPDCGTRLREVSAAGVWQDHWECLSCLNVWYLP